MAQPQSHRPQGRWLFFMVCSFLQEPSRMQDLMFISIAWKPCDRCHRFFAWPCQKL